MGYYTWLTRVSNRIKRKGFFLYTSLVVFATLYMIYSIGPPPSDQGRRGREHRKRRQRGRDGLQETEKGTNGSPSHPVSSWTRKELFDYLTHRKIYPALDTDIESLRFRVITIYDNDFYASKIAPDYIAQKHHRAETVTADTVRK